MCGGQVVWRVWLQLFGWRFKWGLIVRLMLESQEAFLRSRLQRLPLAVSSDLTDAD